MIRPTFAEINLSNLIFNYNSNVEKVGKNVDVMPIVKANAYGHGMIKCVEALLCTKPKPKIFGVALIEETIEFRKKFREPEILIFSLSDPNDFSKLLEENN